MSSNRCKNKNYVGKLIELGRRDANGKLERVQGRVHRVEDDSLVINVGGWDQYFHLGSGKDRWVPLWVGEKPEPPKMAALPTVVYDGEFSDVDDDVDDDNDDTMQSAKRGPGRPRKVEPLPFLEDADLLDDLCPEDDFRGFSFRSDYSEMDNGGAYDAHGLPVSLTALFADEGRPRRMVHGNDRGYKPFSYSDAEGY